MNPCIHIAIEYQDAVAKKATNLLIIEFASGVTVRTESTHFPVCSSRENPVTFDDQRFTCKTAVTTYHPKNKLCARQCRVLGEHTEDYG